MTKGLDPTLGAVLPLLGVLLGVLAGGGITYLTLTAPFEGLIHERDDVEHRFGDAELERHRVALMRAADEFLEREAMHGFMSNGTPGGASPATPQARPRDFRSARRLCVDTKPQSLQRHTLFWRRAMRSS